MRTFIWIGSILISAVAVYLLIQPFAVAIATEQTANSWGALPELRGWADPSVAGQKDGSRFALEAALVFAGIGFALFLLRTRVLQRREGRGRTE
ncbi:hypothetical protein [Leifsonia aquatica]|uniref:hypothetical protein n=1 Tax=Leifsonia aquatica TaxID=144185 RepID=UPI00382CCDD5